MEQRVFRVIEEAGYYVETNPAFPDPSTGKSREFDFGAITASKLFREDFDFLFTNLIGECVNNTQPLVFFLAETPIDFTFHADIKCAGIPLYLPDPMYKDSEMSFQDFFHLDKFHHYCHGTYSTQYCSFRQKSGKSHEWMAWHDDEHHGVFNSLVEATKYNVDEYFTDWSPPKKDEEEAVNLNLFYPVLILHEDLYVCRQTEGRISLRKQNHIQFRKSVISGYERDTFQIDVIVESFVPKYLDLLERENEALVRRLRRKKKDVLEAIDYIVVKARRSMRQKKTKSYKEILEF